jgi:hypothetical protein
MRIPLLALLASSVVSLVSRTAQREVPIPRSVAGDKGSYYLLDARRTGDIVRTLHKRVGPSATGYTKMEVNCRTMMVRDLGYSETSPASIRDSATHWFELTPGSSKSDVAAFACTRTTTAKR